jgi:nucleotide-binding universal stress UspA family protein
VPGILVPIDFSPSSKRQIRAAAELGRGFGTSLLVVHVVVEVRAHGGLHDAIKAHERLRLREARERLARMACATSGGVLVETRVAYGHPADEIARIAIEQEIGLIVMGLTGDGASGSCPGSVAYRVLTMAPAPVLALAINEEITNTLGEMGQPSEVDSLISAGRAQLTGPEHVGHHADVVHADKHGGAEQQ